MIFTLRYGRWVPPIWPLLSFFTAWRRADVRRALSRMRREIGWDGSEDFNLLVGFKRAVLRDLHDVALQKLTERSVRDARVRIFGFVATFDDEIIAWGPVVRYIDWACGGRSTSPLPPWLKP